MVHFNVVHPSNDNYAVLFNHADLRFLLILNILFFKVYHRTTCEDPMYKYIAVSKTECHVAQR